MPYTTVTRNRSSGLRTDVQIASHSWGEPYRPLPYFRSEALAAGSWIGVDGYVMGGAPNQDFPPGNVFRNIQPGSSAYASAYDRMMKKVGEKASLALTVMDRQKSLNMIVARGNQILEVINHIRKGKMLYGPRLRPRKDKRTRKKKLADGSQTLADTWLEYTFGWVPLIQDIYTAIDVMQSSPPAARVRGRAEVSYPIAFDQRGGDDNQAGLKATGVAYGGVSLSCQVVVSNPDLYLANQLGLVNPAGVVWDAIPFSFVVDWFLPVNKFLMSFSNTWGLELRNCSTSFVGHAVAEMDWRGSPTNIQKGTSYAHVISRNIGGFVTPGLLDRLHVPSQSLWLAATVMSMVRQQLNQLPYIKRL